ncbi:MAG: hypothetical protein FJ387_30545, partial [Verrucomicrobia bacterium]|nr:hypothetical protein [Verrucomicrobiota bacterium]
MPNAPLEVNATYTITVEGVTDLAGNLALDQPIASSFATLDTLGPTIATLRLADGRSPVARATVPVEAVLAAAEEGASVRFTQDFQPAGQSTGPAYRVALTLPAEGTTTIRAIGIDRFNNEGPVAELAVTVVPNQHPTVILTRLDPVTGAVASGSTVRLAVRATDDVEVDRITVTASGAVSLVTNLVGGAETVLAFAIAAATAPGTPLEVTAQATDVLGLGSELAIVGLEVSDGTVPLVQIQGPPAGPVPDPAGPLALEVSSSDNSGQYRLRVEVSGVVTASQSADLTRSPNEVSANTFLVSIEGAPLAGGAFTATVRATDSAGHSTVVSRVYTVPDRQPPRLLGVTPAPQATAVSLWQPGLSLELDEPLALATVTPDNLRLSDDAGLAMPYTVSRDPANPRRVQVQPTTLPLPPGVTFSILVAAALTDEAGNRWVQTDGSSPPLEGVVFWFTTGRILAVSPGSGTRVIGGQVVPVTVNFEAGLGASLWPFVLNGELTRDVPVAPEATQATANLTLPATATAAVIAVAAQRSGQPAYALADLTLEVRSRDADDDGDGWANGYEVDRGM